MPTSFRFGDYPSGGILSYPLAQLRQEVASIAWHFHWPYDQIMMLDHQERRAWVQEIMRLTTRS